MIAPILNAIPPFLVSTPRWLLWREIQRKGKRTKAPFTVRNTAASSTNANSWAPFSEIKAVILKRPRLFDGVGFSLGDLGTGDHVAGIDLDSCLDEDGAVADWAPPIVDALNTYIEVSPSETGLKAFFRCHAEDARAARPAFAIETNNWGCKRTVGKLNGKDHGPAIEVYLGPGRYFTVTGKRWPTAPEDVAVLDRATLDRVAQLVRRATGRVASSNGGRDHNRTGRDNSRSAIAFRIGAKVVRDGAGFEQMCDAIRDHADTAEWYREKGEPNNRRELRHIWDKVSNAFVLSPFSPLDSARQLLKRNFTVGPDRTLHHQQSTFYHWTGACYSELPHESLRAHAYAFLDKAQVETKDGIAPFKPNTKSVNNVMDALAAAGQLPVGTKAPTWLDAGQRVAPSEVLAFTNGLLHLPTRRLRPHTPLLFNLHAVDYPYDPKAPEPEAWLKFLNSIWGKDQASIATLQEIFGLTLTTDTWHQKAFLVIGPKRSGKGTIARVQSAVIGKENVVGPTLSSLGDRFGTAPLIGKLLAIISDARLSGRTDPSIIAERILSITGEDAITVDRKNRDCWTGTLPTRFMIFTNEIPRLTDASGALTSRFIVLCLTFSFFGLEDTGLTNKILRERPGILNWSLTSISHTREVHRG